MATQRNLNIDAHGMLFGKWKLKTDTWVLTNRWSNFMYLLIGREKALLLDSGYGEGNLRELVEQITDKPVMVMNTHGHFDHTGGNAWWSEAWMTRDAVPLSRQTFEPLHDVWLSTKPHRDYRENIVRDGDKFDLGGRVVEVISVPAHSESSIALLDSAARLLFTGDELESGQVLLFSTLGGDTVHQLAQRHRANMQKLKARRSEYDFICPAHNGTMLDPDTYLDDFIALDDELLAGTAHIMPDTGGFGFPPGAEATKGTFASFGKLERVQHGQASIVYTKED